MSTPFINAVALVVTTNGPGNLSLLSYADVSGLPSVFGSVPTANTGETRFIISHSYTFQKYAFFFDGSGDAVWSIGSSSETQPVGKSWADAQVATWKSSTITTADVTKDLSGAADVNDEITAFIVPDKIYDLD